MAGTINETIKSGHGNMVVLEFECTADASDGSYPATVIAQSISGQLLAIETNPDGAVAPTDNYDITITQNGVDILEGVGANRDTANSERAAIVFASTSVNPPVFSTDVLTLNITNNSVNSAVIFIKLYVLKS